MCPFNCNCTNTPRSYICTCLPGFEPRNGEPNFRGIPFKCKEDVIPHNERLQQCHAGAAGELEYRTAESFTSVLEQKSTWTKFSREETSALATVLLESVESTTLAALLKPSENVSQTVQTVQTEHLDIESRVITEECHMENVSFNLKAKGDEMKIRCSVIEESESTGTDPLLRIQMEFSLYIISHVGLSISLVCLALAIATFLLCHTIRSRNTFLHLHLCVCLFLAKILFLTGIDKTDNQVGCAIIAGCLHYLFLACFSWMLVEAVMLFLMVRNLKVVNYFSSRSVNMLHLCAFGYGLPGLVVAVSASVYPRGYGMHNRLLTFKAFAQVFILGCSWVLGIFQFGPVASIMAYLFTIINSLQGAFIFFIHCLLSRQVREEYRRWLTGRTKPGSQSQTSGILLSSMPSVSRMVRAVLRGSGRGVSRPGSPRS
ncbi:Adhesion G protein-coupled receptor E1 [Sciurus carolinensis]|uniref:Adhesion G protein-coupled receptor E1 n=1 Tax=Sciurus carolinensis TaxID=30640 RepID=A0AA41MFG1_SCICA|nr:Adhesion G protein-coupled receptor E1 [Sciurus carolinensis]